VAQAIQERFDDLDRLYEIGPLDLNISGCMNACGHHHVGHIGILGVDKHGAEFYQITIGGNQAPARLGRVIGPSLGQEDIPDAIERLIEVYLEVRLHEEEHFVDVVERLGIEPFKARVYASQEREALYA
jgi:sulfite reductase (NADPH) hemoprotein beta-component